jgi:hypothetical protein
MFYRSSIAAAALLGALCATTGDTRAWDDTKYPDFGGQWRPIGGPGRFDISKPRALPRALILTPRVKSFLRFFQRTARFCRNKSFSPPTYLEVPPPAGPARRHVIITIVTIPVTRMARWDDGGEIGPV